MPTLKCDVCGKTSSSGRTFYQCDKCKRWVCSACGYKGKKCPCCHKGFLGK